jgi:hypothetical protein
MSLTPFILFVLVISFLATCLLWRRILARDYPWQQKATHAVFVAIPFLGPMFYIFLVPPSVHARENQLPPFPKGTEVYPSFAPLIKSISRIFGRSGKRNE